MNGKETMTLADLIRPLAQLGSVDDTKGLYQLS